MPTKSSVKRSSMLGSLSVADRAKKFQTESTGTTTTATPAKPNHKRTKLARAALPSSSATSVSASSASLPSSEASASSSHNVEPESVAVLKHARRISVSTPMHRRASSDVSILDPFVAHQLVAEANSSGNTDRRRASHRCTSPPPTVRTSSFAEIEQLAAELEANRPACSKPVSAMQPRRARASSVLMNSITEENMHLRMCPSTETIRGLASVQPRSSFVEASAALRDEHVSFHVSPCLSEDGSIDWHHFVSTNYGVASSLDFRQPISITDLALPISARTRVYQSKLCKADSPTLNDEATWLEEELANCSDIDHDDDDDDNDDELDQHKSFDTVRHSLDEDEYLTPEGSPLLSPVNAMAPPVVEIMGLGIQDASLLLPGQVQAHADKSADSLLEQVAMHEACIRTLNTLSHDERDQASAIASAVNSRQLGLHVPPMPDRRSSLAVPSTFQHPGLRNVGSNGDFSVTQSDSSGLFGDDTYDASLSPMADMGHGPSGHNPFDGCGERRASAASYLSTDSTASADLSIASHGSSLLYNVHLVAPRMERAGSTDTTVSTRRSSIASSYAAHEKTPAPVKPPRSPLRINAPAVLPTLTQEACEATPQPAQRGAASPAQEPHDLVRMKAMPLPPLPLEADKPPRSSRESARVLRQAGRRKAGTDQPQPPARLDSLDTMVAAAPKETQLREEFPERLLGDWMSAAGSKYQGDYVVERREDEHVVRVEPVPLHKRIRNKDGTTYLPGLGEIVPPSPDVAVAQLLMDDDIPVYPGSAARKHLGVGPVAAPSVLSPSATLTANKSASTTTLKSKLSGRFSVGNAAAKIERKSSESSLPNVLGRRMRKASVASSFSNTAAASTVEMPSAWKDRLIGKRPSMDLRRPSLTSLTSASTSASSSSSTGSGGTLLPTAITPEPRSRSSMGFRKMLSSITGSSTDPTAASPEPPATNTPHSAVSSATAGPQPRTLQALAASTFESPKAARRLSVRRPTRKYESFMQLSDDDDEAAEDSASTADVDSPPPVAKNRKDLTKILGASEVDLSQPLAAKRSTGWHK
ncbi:hypothetical protein EX895_005731 [Sporisorium graminicola]|uniref:Uncharacterized protein n=1 Tax=Sporisorium graminicola TaxID=280036 RepID=A0A4V6YEL5_9BASI|nr:hypothetical protein EX895_005731 [Sporisorium graminicola]TKY85569.1 hypothetical protein EX895_005731 [Sporisorium graminicola]